MVPRTRCVLSLAFRRGPARSSLRQSIGGAGQCYSTGRRLTTTSPKEARMATHDSIGVERRRAGLDDNRPRTHPKHSGCKAGDALDRLCRARTDQPTTDARVDGQEQIGGEQ
jgi:hypothetical protein